MKSIVMKFIYIILFSFAGHLLFSSCTKDADIVKQVPISSVTVVNAIVNSSPIIVNFTNADSVASYFSSAALVSYAGFFEYSVPSGNIPVSIYPLADTTHPLFKGTILLKRQSIYSFFLVGINNAQNKPDTVIIEDHIPYHPSIDSTIGIRFINLSPNSNPISVNIMGGMNNTEVSNLPYKDFTDFKLYPATTNTTQYIFEIRDASSSNLLITFTCPVSPFQNATIVVDGVNAGGSNSLGAFIVNNY